MQPNLLRKFKTLGFICIFTSLAGIMFQLIDENHVNINSIFFGLPLGLGFGLLELFIFPNKKRMFRSWSFMKLLWFKTILFTTVIYFVSLSVTIITGISEGRQLSELNDVLLSVESFALILYTLAVYAMLLFILQINLLFGTGVLMKFMTGKYYKPREEERIFMFLDMKSSTTIAERLGHVKFYNLLNEVFHEITQPVLDSKAEIYQYVGDEVVLTWQVEEGLRNSNCLNAFFLFQKRLEKNSERYFKKYGVKPAFKAGLHFGKVITAQIGDLKREIVYNGDVLNTTSRIQSECNKYNRECLVSGSLKNRIKENGLQWERIDQILLRGKETEVEIYSVSQ